MIRGSVLLAACVGLWSCNSDPTGDAAGKPVKIIADPSLVFIQQDSSQLISLALVDEFDGLVPDTWTLTGSSPNFTVALDSAFRPVFNPDGSLTLTATQGQVRATITGKALGIATFTAAAGGKSLSIQVNVVPGTLRAVFTPANPAPGDTVTMTMPATLRLSPTSAVTFPGNLNPIIVSRAADSLSLRFISAPTTDTTAVVTQVFNAEFPTIPVVTYTTQDKVTGSKSAQWTGKLPATLSPLVAGALTVTLNPVFAFKTSAPPSVFSFPTQTAPIINSISPDSTVANLAVGPNVASPLQVTRVTFKGAPQFAYQLVSEDSVISGVVSVMPVSYSTATPTFAQNVVITGDAGFRFSPTAQIVLAGKNLPVVARAGDGTTVTVKNLPGGPGAGLLTINGAVAPSAPAFSLTLPSDDPLTLGQMVLAAPGGILVVPDTSVMQSSTLGFPSRVYTTTLASAAVVEVTVTYATAADLGLYILDAGGNILGAADSFGSSGGGGGNGQPELSGPVVLPAGTYTFAMLTFGPPPATYTMSILTQ
jgi:hypothetical protein